MLKPIILVFLKFCHYFECPELPKEKQIFAWSSFKLFPKIEKFIWCNWRCRDR
jgi:hypothetical protein